MTKKNIAALIMVMVIGIGGCGEGNGASGKTAEFSGSDCKSHLYLPPAGPAPLYTMEQSEPYQGLQCVSWQHDETNVFSIDLINFHGACGAEYVGDYAAGDEGELNLLVNNPGCMIAACGYCVYDWSFEVDDVATDDLTINVTENACPEKDDYSVDEYTFEIPKVAMETGAGISCSYKSITDFENPSCGTLHQPCYRLASDDNEGDSLCGEAATTRCDEGYSCTQTDDMPQPYCVAECTETADCPLQPLLTCDDGLCLLK